jgi:hypothetical protein
MYSASPPPESGGRAPEGGSWAGGAAGRVGIGVGLTVGVADGGLVGPGVGLAAGDGVVVRPSVEAGEGVGGSDGVGVGDGDAEGVGVPEDVGGGDAVGVGVSEGVGDGDVVGVGVSEGAGVGVSAVTPPTKLSASAISMTIAISGVVSSMCSIVTVRPLPATGPSIVRGTSTWTSIVPVTTPGRLTLTGPGAETDVHGPTGVCCIHKPENRVPVLLLDGPAPASTLFDCARMTVAVTISTAETLRLRPLTSAEQVAST